MGKIQWISSQILATSVDELLALMYSNMNFEYSSTFFKNKTLCKTGFEAEIVVCLCPVYITKLESCFFVAILFKIRNQSGISC